MKIGYAKVSTGDQNLDLQMDALNKIECDKVFTDKMSGARSDRPGLDTVGLLLVNTIRKEVILINLIGY